MQNFYNYSVELFVLCIIVLITSIFICVDRISKGISLHIYNIWVIIAAVMYAIFCGNHAESTLFVLIIFTLILGAGWFLKKNEVIGLSEMCIDTCLILALCFMLTIKNISLFESAGMPFYCNNRYYNSDFNNLVYAELFVLLVATMCVFVYHFTTTDKISNNRHFLCIVLLGTACTIAMMLVSDFFLFFCCLEMNSFLIFLLLGFYNNNRIL